MAYFQCEFALKEKYCYNKAIRSQLTTRWKFAVGDEQQC
jgi:hypothetical protein